jgi:redox-sensitive bicupin YhaK (pirin superfamily)
MKSIFHPHHQRGHANHGWLNSHHSFSFANYYDPSKMHFGALRVLNDDEVAPGMGFGTHPHDNMEIISIPLEGTLAHKDSMGNASNIESGEIQIMSAGTGIQHSEFNASKTHAVKFLQIWIFPNVKDAIPRYEQQRIPSNEGGSLVQIASPSPEDQGIWMHQNAWLHLGSFMNGGTFSYTMKGKNHGVYAFVLKGSFEMEGLSLGQRDAAGFWETTEITATACSDESQILLLEVPMTW